MRVLFIAPLPPPIDGQSKASKVVLEALLNSNFVVDTINLSKTDLKSGRFGRFFEIFSHLKEIKKKLKTNKYDIIYLSLAESFLGNMRDLAIYSLLKNNIGKTIIHMLGGAGMREILSKNGWQKNLNANYFQKIKAIIVEGPQNAEAFEKVVDSKKIYKIPNFAEDFLFVDDQEIDHKFSKTKPIEILYLSNLIHGKGYMELLDAFLRLNAEEQERFHLSFVGGFDNDVSEKDFHRKISGHQQITYLGKFIDGEEKRKKYCKSHIFCLPTYYPFEGQPISILEAYATGCFVITTNHSGIPFVFTDKKNGILVEKKSVDALLMALRKILLTDISDLKNVALTNRNTAFNEYRTSIFQEKVIQVFNKN